MRARIALLVSGVLLIAATLLPATIDRERTVTPASVPAKPADSVPDGVGFFTHLAYTDTSYNAYSTVVKPRVLELGVRHLRDVGFRADINAKFNDLAASGVKFQLVIDPLVGVQPQDAVGHLQKVLNAVESVEGPNEMDAFRQTYNGQAFPEGLRAYQDDLYAAIKGDPSTSHLPVVAPSLAFVPTTAKQLGRLESVDAGNMHSYPSGHVPGTYLDQYFIPSAIRVAGQKPLMSTETGYNTGCQKAGCLRQQPSLSEAAQAKYLPRQLVEHLRRGVDRVYFTELLDTKNTGHPEKSWGVVRADGSPKPSFHSMRNLMTLLEDRGPAFTPGSLAYTLSGDMTNVSTMFLQKRDGSFWLLIYQNVPSYEDGQWVKGPTGSFYVSPGKDINVPNRPITLTLPTAAKSIKTYLPYKSMTPSYSGTSVKQLKLGVPDHVVAVEIRF